MWLCLRGYVQQSYVPGGQKNGLEFTVVYGYVGIAVELEDFVADGLNEVGLAAGLFYFPHYGSYEAYDEEQRESTLSDLQLVPWMLSQFKTVDEVKRGTRNGACGVVRPACLYGSLAHCGRFGTTGRVGDCGRHSSFL